VCVCVSVNRSNVSFFVVVSIWSMACSWQK